MTRFVLDSHGDRWPVTGHWCAICAMPMRRIWPDQTAHPCCALNTGPQQPDAQARAACNDSVRT